MTPLTFFILAIVLLFITGFYGLLITRNFIRILLALEVLTKGLTLFLILSGRLNGEPATAQAYVITVIIIEVVIITVAAGIVLGIFHINDSLDTRKVKNLKG